MFSNFKAKMGVMGFGLSTEDNDIKERLQKLEEIREQLKDVYKKMEKKCIEVINTTHAIKIIIKIIYK